MDCIAIVCSLPFPEWVRRPAIIHERNKENNRHIFLEAILKTCKHVTDLGTFTADIDRLVKHIPS